MRLSRYFALALAVLTALFLAYVWLEEALAMLPLGMVGFGALLMLAVGLGRSRSTAGRWLLVAATSLYSLLLLAALGLQVGQEVPLAAKIGLAVLMMIGAMLCLRCCYQVNRVTRYGFNNYYDRAR